MGQNAAMTKHRSLCWAAVSLAAAMLFACGKAADKSKPKADDKPTSAGSGSAVPVAKSQDPAIPSNGSGSGNPAPSSAISTADKCKLPGLFLADTAYADLQQTLCTACNLCDATFSCDDRDVMRNTIYARHGKVFAKKRWKELFHGFAWYSPNATFKDSEITAQESNNVAELKKDCKKEVIPAAEVTAIKQWLTAGEDLAAKLPLVTDSVGDAGNTAVAFKDESAQIKAFRKLAARPFDSGYPSLSLARHDYKTSVVIYVHETADPNFVCNDPDEGCEGGFGLYFTFEAQKLVGVKVDMSACPFVTVQVNGRKPIELGEILRNIDRAAWSGPDVVQLKGQVCGGDVVDLVVEEREAEVTHLNSLELMIGSRVLAPLKQLAVPAVLALGEATSVRFEIPGELPCSDASVIARGYYQRLRR